jgi:Cys-rich four helix bundle protein (predicted Tat secretion target)
MAISASLGAIACGARNAAAEASVAPVASGAGASLLDAALECQKRGLACDEHCLRLLAGGDTSMAECAAAVRAMLAATEALARLAGSRHVRAAAQLALEVCETCEGACAKHAQHPPCHDCAESCARMIGECKKALAS